MSKEEIMLECIKIASSKTDSSNITKLAKELYETVTNVNVVKTNNWVNSSKWGDLLTNSIVTPNTHKVFDKDGVTYMLYNGNLFSQKIENLGKICFDSKK